MDRILQGLHGFAVAYLDDIHIHSSTLKKHLENLIIIFNKLREAGLTVKKPSENLGKLLVYTWVMWLAAGLSNPCKVKCLPSENSVDQGQKEK